ncbi:MAG: L-glutamate gamma-semialdehyde dehydrogenase [Planctomycetota bacterium]|nr:L-glutamate gamma-semialdehyde dehydrogenase [Planctomycetota bacterium]
MLNTVFRRDEPANEPVKAFAPGSPERESLAARLAEMSNETVEIPCIVGGEEVRTGDVVDVTAPHDHSKLICRWHRADAETLHKAVQASQEAWKDWSNQPPHVRMSVLEKAANLLAGPWRDTVNAATMLGQSKTCHQAEIDSACELIDFYRLNSWMALTKIYTEQPTSTPDTWNYVDHRPLEGFVMAITPFNFTSIAGNLPTAPALMGNVVLWKPSKGSMLSNYYVMKLLEEAGFPPGVINFVPNSPKAMADSVFGSEHFSGLHFTGSTGVFQKIWLQTAENLAKYRTYPRIVGETGGKDFIFVHESADLDALVVAALRGAYEFQGQKCSAASRMYVPDTLWPAFRDRLVAEIEKIKMGDPADFSNFMCAVIDKWAYQDITGYVDKAKAGAKILTGGGYSDDQGWFVEPTLVECEDPRFVTMEEEIFGPVLSVYVYKADDMEGALDLCDTTSPYALTGAVFSQDRGMAEYIGKRLRQAAGNFYINDKPTGAVVNQQPFGGARASGTDDKAGGPQNLVRWIAPRSVKENFLPPKDWRYPFMD